MKMNLLKNSITFIVSGAFALNLQVAHAGQPSCEVLKASLSEPTAPLKVVSKPESEIDRLTKIRPCLKTYPWPKGLFLVDNDDSRAITAREMKEAKADVEEFIDLYKSGRIRKLVKLVDSNPAAFIFAHWTSEGWDHELLERFGYFLYIQTLMAEGNLDEAKKQIDEVFRKWNVSARKSNWDEGDENTYFSRETQDNIFLLLKYNIYSQIGASDREEALKVASDFAAIRKTLSDEIEFLGDPAEDLLWNAGCY
ncbi:MAG: hypothetical protein AAF526_00160 [Pseudomonadota bacterium]